MSSSSLYAALKVTGIAVIALIVAAMGYGAFTAIRYWTGIGV